MKKTSIVLTLVFLSFLLQAQNKVQVIRGEILDDISKFPIIGASITVVGSDPIIGSITDENGQFLLPEVPVGQQTLEVSYLGYENKTLSNLNVISGKELILNIALEESATALEEIVVTSQEPKNKALNSMSTVSTRTFSVEETQKYAAAINDPARMAQSFAGVVSGDDGNNQISIRGNSPSGLLWRMEGVEIPNPNHFANEGSSGGGISVLSAQVMGNSDFSTGAFAAEYGNALGGVFDLKLRKGNNSKREHTFQLGLLGIDVATEGPLKKGYGGSYLINYRYSTLSLLGKLGLDLFGTTNFQDVSFNFNLPTKKMGTFSVFGMGGLSSQSSEAKTDSLSIEEDEDNRIESSFKSNMGVAGIKNFYQLNSKSYVNTVLAISRTENNYEEKTFQEGTDQFGNEYNNSYNNDRITLSSTYSKKLNSTNNIRTGFVYSNRAYGLNLNYFSREENTHVTVINSKGRTSTMQAHFQWQSKLTPKLKANAGMHYLHFVLNNSNSIEPRLSFDYEINSRNNVTLGYGLHSQIQPIGAYFAQSTETRDLYNKKMELSKAHHLVLAYDHVINSVSHIKAEAYYQRLFDVPVGTGENSNYAIINQQWGYPSIDLVNEGVGKNLGLELTYERFLHKNLYYIFAGSIGDSKYKTPTSQWLNTRYNTKYSMTSTIGKEWVVGKSKQNTFGVNLKTVFIGGYWDTPINLEASKNKGEEVLFEDKPFSEKYPDYFRLDVRLSYKKNAKNRTSTISLDLQNATIRENTGGRYFSETTGEIETWYQVPFIPVLAYKIEF